MVDNVSITAGSGTTIAADDVGGALHQRVKATWGPDGTGNDVDVATGKPLPVQVRSATGLIPLGEPTDAKSTATDTTSASAISIWKQISASMQAAATSLAGTLTVSGGSGGGPATIADGADVTLGAKADAKSTATDGTAVSAMSVWKQISASVQAAASSVAGTLTVATHAVTQSGTWTVQPGNTANTTAWKVDGSAVTQPVSAASLPLPSGAAAAAKQPALGTAGAASADVLTVQGIASGTALAVSAASLPLPSGAATSANQSTVITGVGAPADAAYSSGSGSVIAVLKGLYTALTGSLTVATHAVTQSGTWNVTNVSGTVSLPTGASTSAKQPALGTAGSSSTDVLSVQGIASGTAMPVSAAALPLPSGASTAAKQPALGVAGTPSADILTVQAATSNMLRGANSATNTSATTVTGMGAQGAGVKIYVTGVQVFRTDAGATMSYVTLNDGASTPIPLPPTGGSAIIFNTPLVVAANTAFQFTPHDALTTVFCSAQGYSGA